MHLTVSPYENVRYLVRKRSHRRAEFDRPALTSDSIKPNTNTRSVFVVLAIIAALRIEWHRVDPCRRRKGKVTRGAAQLHEYVFLFACHSKNL